MNGKARKKALRKAALKKRRDLDPSYRLEASGKIARKLLSLGRRLGWRLICCYCGYNSEVQTEEYIKTCLEEGLRTAVPYVDPVSHGLYFSEVQDISTELITNQYGIKEPKRMYLRVMPPGSFDAIIVPGTAFDPTGHRLGYGLGFYDHCLQDIRGRVLLIGLAFDSQMTEELPAEEHDIPVDLVMTETTTYVSDREKPAILTAATIEEML